MSSGMRFYDLPRSPWCQMVRIVLAEKGLPHERHIVLPGQETEDWFLGINPLGRLPVLVERDLIVRNATVINEYLEEAYPDRRLLPDSWGGRARVRMLVALAEESIGGPLDEFLHAKLIDEEDDPALLEDLEAEVIDGIGLLEEDLDRKTTFAAGNQFSLADAALAPFLLGLVPELGMRSSLAAFPIVRDYLERLSERPSIAVIRQGWTEWNEMVATLG